MQYIILDLEATCWENKGQQPNEIIEIGAISIHQDKEVISEFNAFIKPTVHPILSDFCIELTSIQQKDVDQADFFPVVLEDFLHWIKANDEEYYLCSWGFYDRKQFEQDCKLHGIDILWLENHISLKHQYGYLRNFRRAPGMKAALRLENIPLEGTHHRGMDDARNIAKIFLKYFDLWDYKK